jgi:hypothetical protein
MSKRIFTKVMMGECQTTTGPVVRYNNAIDQYLVQEDIEIVGAQICVVPQLPSENDGFTFVAVELSQTGIYGQDGSILSGMADEGWNTTPAGIALANANVTITFPQGTTVPVKEEGHLYLNILEFGKSAGTSIYEYIVTIYYTKKGSR